MPFPPTSRLTVVCLAALMLTGCASQDSDPASGSSASTSTEHSGAHSDSPSSSPTSSSAAPADETVEVSVSVRGGKVHPPTQRVKIDEGKQVRLIITSDVDDQVHVHGFDVEADLEAGRPATVEFLAHQSGLFEVETHETELLLLQLEVR